MATRITRVAALALLLAAPLGCTDEKTSPSPSSTTEKWSAAPPIFDDLDFRLELASNEVASGGALATTLIVENHSGHDVTDPGCQIPTGRYALIPADEPSAELWQQPIAECVGPVIIANGSTTRNEGPTFRARTKFGDPLPAGDYLAVLQIKGRSERLEYPVQIT